MTKRSFDDAFWGDPFVQDLDKDSRLLFLYLWTNKRCNSAGLYEITPKTICFETGIENDNLPKLFNRLESRVKWLPDKNIVWVKNFVKHQPQSPFVLKSVANCLALHDNGLVGEFLDYNTLNGVSIPYRYPLHTVSSGYRYLTDIDIDNNIDIDKDNNKGQDLSAAKKLERGELVAEVFARVDKLRGYRPPKRNAEAASIIRMLKAYNPDQIITCWEKLKADKFWDGKELYMMSVEGQIGAVVNGANKGSHKANKVPTKPEEYTPPEEW